MLKLVIIKAKCRYLIKIYWMNYQEIYRILDIKKALKKINHNSIQKKK